jgi:uncharacterized protein (DUF488 family)
MEQNKPTAEDMERLAKLAEESYSRVYDASDKTAAAGAYSDMKDYFIDAMRLAKELGLADRAAALEKRYFECVAVCRDQLL